VTTCSKRFFRSNAASFTRYATLAQFIASGLFRIANAFYSQAVGAADDGSSKTALPHSPVAIELQEDGMRQPIDMGIQAANAVAQPLGQHRNYTVRQVNTVAAALRLAIECAAGPHIRAYVCVDASCQPPLISRRECVVKIARVV